MTKYFAKYNSLLELVIKEYKLNIYGDHGIRHWERVYDNTQKLSVYYNEKSEVFELFALLHDSKRENEYEDILHGKRAADFAKKLISNGTIHLSSLDRKRLIFACENHTKPNKKVNIYKDKVVQICLDSDRLDIGRVGIIPEEEYFCTEYAKELVRNMNLL